MAQDGSRQDDQELAQDEQRRAARARRAAARGRARAKQAVIDKTPERFKNPTNLQVRTRTGAVYIGLSIVCVLLGEVPTVVYLVAVAAVCAGEFYYMMRVDAKLPNEIIGAVAAAAYPAAMWLWGLPGVALVTFAMMVALIVWYTYYLRARIADVSVSCFGAIYTGMFLSGLIIIRRALPEPWGGVLLLLLFASVWFNDALAYLVGSRFGKHKLAPRTSPKKSWEGFFGGLFASVLFWCLMSFVPGVTMPLPEAAVFGLIAGSCGVVGDLMESRIKRNVGVKDSGTIMPGHGGLLDRCDSLFLAVAAAIVLLLGGGCIPYVL